MAEADDPIEAVVDALNAAGVEYVLIAIDVSSLPLYVPRLHEPVVLIEDVLVEMSQSMRILGRSVDGDRVLGRSGAGISSVARNAFSATRELEQDVIRSRVDGRMSLVPLDRSAISNVDCRRQAIECALVSYATDVAD